MLDADFVDLFAGAGLAARGLVQAGWEARTAIGNWRPAASAWAANFDGGICQTVEASQLRATSPWARTPLVWMSLPRIWGSALYRAGDVPADQLLARWGEVAGRYSPCWVVCEYERLFVPMRTTASILQGLGQDYELTDFTALCPYMHLGGPARRERMYAIYTHRAAPVPLTLDPRARVRREAPIFRPPSGATARDVLDVSLDVMSLCSPYLRPERARRLVKSALEQGGGIVTLGTTPGVSGLDEPHPEVPHRQDRMIYAYNGGWRWPSVGEWRRALGVPSEHALLGSEPAQMRMLGEGTDVRVAHAIGLVLMHAARTGGLVQPESMQP